MVTMAAIVIGGLLGMFALQLLLFWGYVVSVEKGSSAAVKGVLGASAAAVTPVLVLGLVALDMITSAE